MCGVIRPIGNRVCRQDNKILVTQNSGIFLVNSRLIIFLKKTGLVDLDSYVIT
jgi:hypothetical protein